MPIISDLYLPPRPSFRQKPYGRPFGINWNLAPRGLLCTFPLADPASADIARGNPPSGKGTASSFGGSTYGLGVTLAGTSGQSFKTWQFNDWPATNQPFSIEILFYFTSTTAVVTTCDLLASVNNASGGSANGAAWGIACLTNGNNTLSGFLNNGANITSPAWGITLGLHSLVAVFTGAALSLYVDGVLTGSVTSTETTAVQNWFNLGGIGSTDTSPIGTALLINVATAAWSPVEIMNRWVNPYGFLQYGLDYAVGSASLSAHLLSRSSTMVKSNALAAGRTPLLANGVTQVKGRVTTPHILALLARSAAMVKARLLTAGSTLLRSHSETQVKSRALAAGLTHLLAHGKAQVEGRARSAGATSLRSRALTAVKSRLTAAGNVLLHSKSAAQTKARAFPFIGLILNAKGSLKVKAHVLAHASAAVFTRSSAKVKAHALASGTTPILARSSTKVKARTSLFVGLLVTAHSSTKVKAHALASGTSAIFARSSAKVKGRALSSGATRLLAHTVTMVKGRALIHSGALFALLARSSLMVKSRAVRVGTAAMRARGEAQTKGRALSSGALSLLAHSSTKVKGHALLHAGALAALLSRSTMMVKSRALSSGTVTMFSRGSIKVKGRAFFTTGAMIALLARSSTKVKAHARVIGTAFLQVRGVTQTKGRARAAGSVLMRVRSAAQNKASASIQALLFLRSRSRTVVKGRATGRSFVILVSRAATMVKGRALSSFGFLRLFARGLTRVTGKAFTGVQLFFDANYVASSPPIFWIADDMEAVRDLSPALAGSIEGETVCFDFGPRLAATVGIVSVISVTCVCKWGFDPTPQSRINGAPILFSSPATGIANQAVLQNILGGVGGVTYLLTCLVECSDELPRSIEVCMSFYTPF